MPAPGIFEGLKRLGKKFWRTQIPMLNAVRTAFQVTLQAGRKPWGYGKKHSAQTHVRGFLRVLFFAARRKWCPDTKESFLQHV